MILMASPRELSLIKSPPLVLSWISFRMEQVVSTFVSGAFLLSIANDRYSDFQWYQWSS